MRVLKVALIGFGGIGAVHKSVYDSLEREGAPIKLVAVCDRNRESIKNSGITNLGAVDIGTFDGINIYDDCDELIKNEEFDVADICLPTFLHKDFTVKLLSAGKHVLCEKPMALCYGDCLEMVSAAEKNARELLVGQCLRFDPAYVYLKELVDGGRFGKARRITMGRLSYMPAWGGWFSDLKKSGGCIVDFHIHDVDILRFIFGEPEAVSSLSYPPDSKWQYVSTRLVYDGMIAEAVASFDESPTSPFSMTYRVRFDRATVLFDGERVTVYPEEGESYSPELENNDRIAEEIKYFADIILNDRKNTKNPPSDAAKSIRAAELIARSAELGGDLLPCPK